ncbi:hypothetical protein FJTKL_02232 [Diaporthe vaccinii]|uniref:Ankyrin repeat protein n=1 Tax=Diaporthe vaccinii TaxID=105482 RepID=A0ABR4F3D5_9PEZI
MEEFRQTLTRFNQTLKTKKVFSRLGIPTRDPVHLDIDYVLSIAVRLSEWKHTSDEITTCRRFARQFCHKAVKSDSLLWGLIGLAPTDIYGSLISGGFTIALTAIEAHEKLRAEMEQSLARIPKELNKIRRLSNIYIQRDELHRRADEVLVSIFVVLERIIERLSRSWKESISRRIKGDEGSVQDALQTLSDSIAEFNEEAEVCAQLRMGRMEETGQAVKLTVERTMDVVNGTSAKVTDMESNLKEMCDKQNILLGDCTRIIGFMNQLYSFMASNPVFNAADGTVNRKYLLSNKNKDGVNRSRELVEKWSSGLGDFEPSPKGEIKKLIEHSQMLTLKEQDKVQYIMGCQQFQDWLGKARSTALCVRAESAPDDIVNFMSVSTAMLALTLGGTTGFIALSFFCSLRKKASSREQEPGALGILNSLNGQLLQIMLDRQVLIKPEVDQGEDLWSRSTESFKHSRRLFKKLISLFPSGSVVFVLLDSVSRISGDKGLVDDIVKGIMRIGRHSPSIVVKPLVTDPVPSSHIWRAADFQLYVPDDVDGWQCGMNVESMRTKNALKLRNLEELQDES